MHSNTKKKKNQEERKENPRFKRKNKDRKLTAVLDFRGVNGRKEKKSSEKERRKHLAEIKRHNPQDLKKLKKEKEEVFEDLKK